MSNEIFQTQLVTFAQLQQESYEVSDSKNVYQQLIALLNKPVPMHWVKKHETVTVKVNGNKVPLLYLPIDKVRYLLNKIFGLGWRDEIISEGVMFNSTYVKLRLHYCIPGTSVWLFKEGVGAVGVQTNKDAAASELSAIKSDGVMKALPASASYALSNAAEKLGDLFGANLNKSETVPYQGNWNPESEDTQTSEPATTQPSVVVPLQHPAARQQTDFNNKQYQAAPVSQSAAQSQDFKIEF